MVFIELFINRGMNKNMKIFYEDFTGFNNS
jgi:hypothetical protein